MAFGKARVPYLRDWVVEEHAELLLKEWVEANGAVEIPVCPEDLIELHLGLTYEVEDLHERFGVPNVLGAIWFSERTIRIDTTLDPHEHPPMLGRYNFTLAHEIGHWRLHRDHLRKDPTASALFEENGDPAFVCRDGTKAREEWQADYFASCLLMPRKQLWEAWTQWRGSDAPVALTELEVPTCFGDRCANERVAMERFCKPLADQFGVSAQAMRIRLDVLKLLVREIEPELF